MTKLRTSQLIQRWRTWLRVIHNDIVTLTHNRRMMSRNMQIVQANPKLPTSNAVYGWMIDGYVALATSAVRRQIDHDPRVISFSHLLSSIQASPHAITRDWFVAQYVNLPPQMAHKDFDRFAPGSQKYTDSNLIASDLTNMENAARAIKVFVNKHVAHRDRRVALGKPSSATRVTWGELNKAVDLFGGLLQKYELLLNQAGLLTVEPVIQEDWRTVFRQRWII